jgi:hypothetical protein
MIVISIVASLVSKTNKTPAYRDTKDSALARYMVALGEACRTEIDEGTRSANDLEKLEGSLKVKLQGIEIVLSRAIDKCQYSCKVAYD